MRETGRMIELKLEEDEEATSDHLLHAGHGKSKFCMTVISSLGDRVRSNDII